MRCLVDVEQPRGVDAGVDLCRRQAGVAQQFLDGTQIAAAAKDAWERLCGFLGHPVPDTPFPWKNSKAMREQRVAKHGSKERLRKARKERTKSAA